MKRKCKKCGKDFKMGYNGTVHGCDKCNGVERDGNGYFWMPDEETAEFEDVETGEVRTVKRRDALK